MSMPGAHDRRVTPRVRGWLAMAAAVAAAAAVCAAAPAAALAQAMPVLTEPVTDAAGAIDVSSSAAMDQLIRALLAASGDVVVVATVPTVAPYADAREYAVKLFENGGRGIGRKGKDNGLLVLLAVKERQVRIEVGYDLESIVTDGFAGQTSRETMVPFFKKGEYGQGLLAGVQRLISRIASARGVTLENLPAAPRFDSAPESKPSWIMIIIAIYVALVIIRMALGSRITRPRSRWGGGGWSGWSGGVGGFGGGGGSSGGFGGGFGGFSGGSSGGGGGGASW
jgi:uncharacterized protein